MGAADSALPNGERAAGDGRNILYEGEMMMNGIGLLLTLVGLFVALAAYCLYEDRRRDWRRREDRLIQRTEMKLRAPRTNAEIWYDDLFSTDDLHSRKVPAPVFSVRPDVADRIFDTSQPVIELRPDVKEALEDLHRHLYPVS